MKERKEGEPKENLVLRERVSYLPVRDERRQLGEEISSGVLVGGILAVEGHDVVVGPQHLVEVELHLFGLPSSVFHGSLHDLADAILRVELGRVAEVSRVERRLHVLDVVDVSIRILLDLVDVEVLRRHDVADIVDEALPLRVLRSHDTLDEVGKGRFVLLVLDHREP